MDSVPVGADVHLFVTKFSEINGFGPLGNARPQVSILKSSGTPALRAPSSSTEKIMLSEGVQKIMLSEKTRNIFIATIPTDGPRECETGTGRRTPAMEICEPDRPVKNNLHAPQCLNSPHAA